MNKSFENLLLEENKIEKYLEDPNFNINDYFGYIYITHNTRDDNFYLGRKVFFFNQKKKLGKKELLIEKAKGKRGRTPTHKRVIKESDWRTYYGSHNDIKKWAKEIPECLDRYVVRLCTNKKELTYYENKYLFKFGVIEPNSPFINDNIEGRYFTKDFE